MNAKFNKLMEKLGSDEVLTEKLMVQETAEEAQGILRGAGLEFSIEEMKELRNIMLKLDEAGMDGELSDEDLEEVAGGLSWRDFTWENFKRSYNDNCGDSWGKSKNMIRRVFRGW